jgi:hypothetical protein
LVQPSGTDIQLSDTLNGANISVPVNSTEQVKTFGYGIGLDYNIGRNYTIGFNFSSDELDEKPVSTGSTPISMHLRRGSTYRSPTMVLDLIRNLAST